MTNATPYIRPRAGWNLVTLAAAVAFAFAGADAAPVRQGPVQVELLAQRETVKPGDTVWLGLQFQLDPEWHLYWVNPGSVGFPPSVTWETGPAIAVEPLRFPVPKVFTGSGQASYGYEHGVLLLAPARVAPGAAGQTAVKAVVEWLACDPKSCVPGKVEVSLPLRVGPEASAARPEFEAAIAQLPQASPWKMTAAADLPGRLLRLRVEPEREPFPSGKLEFFLEQPGIANPAAPARFAWEGKVLVVELRLADDFKEELPGELSGLLVARDGSLGPPLRLSSGAPGPAGGTVSSQAVPVAQNPPEEGKTGEGKTSAGGGEGWGSWLQKPLVVQALAALMFLIGLNLMGVFEVGTGLTGAGGNLGRAEGPAGSFLSGGLATIVATPCTAPFMGSAIFYALGQPAVVTLLIFTFLALGMATPYLVLSRFPRLIDRLPRPGPWMETLKQALAFPMFAVVIWLLWVLSFQVSQNGLLAALTALLLLAMAVWWYGRFATPVASRRVRLAAQLGPLALAGLALLLGNRASGERLPEKSLNVEEQIRDIQAQGKGVFVDFTAAWCLTCQANKAAMHSAKVREALAANRVEFLEVDWTRRDPEIHRVLQKYGREGVPLYLFFPPGDKGEPRVLPNLLTEDIILKALREPGAAAAPGAAQPGFWGALLGAFLGGLILNLMPCVFPVISLKILGFVAQAGSDAKRIWHHGLAFAAGVLAFFWLLALLLLAARAGLGA